MNLEMQYDWNNSCTSWTITVTDKELDGIDKLDVRQHLTGPISDKLALLHMIAKKLEEKG